MTHDEALDQWWFNLDEEARRLALAVPPGGWLSEQAVRDLRRHGVRVPEVALSWRVAGGHGDIAVHPQPAEVRAYLDLLRPVAQRCGR
ncbi:hypothetical protein [Kineococcus sp. SYSU DK006]|uniref:hypothetical protein n=1 Tax=Kineococcus sp. SYSU DK006 TaxID=3383127 RepID=UPI003D7CF85D